mgnify:CR=1 FL=1
MSRLLQRSTTLSIAAAIVLIDQLSKAGPVSYTHLRAHET